MGRPPRTMARRGAAPRDRSRPLRLRARRAARPDLALPAAGARLGPRRRPPLVGRRARGDAGRCPPPGRSVRRGRGLAADPGRCTSRRPPYDLGRGRPAPPGDTFSTSRGLRRRRPHPTDGRALLVVGREVRFWDVATGKPVGPRLTYHDTFGIPRRSPSARTGPRPPSPTTKWLWLVNVPDGKTTGPSFPPPGLLTDLSFSPDGKSLWLTTPASVPLPGRDDRPRRLAGRRGARPGVPGRDPRPRRAPAGRPRPVAASRCGTRRRAIGPTSRPPRSSNPGAVAFTPDGKGPADRGPVGPRRRTLGRGAGQAGRPAVRCPSFFTGASFRPDGRALAVEGASGVVRLVRLPEPAAGDAAGLARGRRR